MGYRRREDGRFRLGCSLAGYFLALLDKRCGNVTQACSLIRRAGILPACVQTMSELQARSTIRPQA
jgi:hypothetical protein